MLTSAKLFLPYYSEYFKYPTAKKCVKKMYEADKKGKIVLQFFDSALKKAGWQKNEEIKRLLNRAKELFSEKKASQKVLEKFKEIKPRYKEGLRKEKDKQEKKIKEAKKAENAFHKQKKQELQPKNAEEIRKTHLVQRAINSDDAVRDISRILYSMILTTRDDLIKKEYYKAEDIADMMEEPYEATVDS